MRQLFTDNLYGLPLVTLFTQRRVNVKKTYENQYLRDRIKLYMLNPDLEQVGVFLETLVPVHSNVKDNPNDYIHALWNPRSRLVNRRWTDSILST